MKDTNLRIRSLVAALVLLALISMGARAQGGAEIPSPGSDVFDDFFV